MGPIDLPHGFRAVIKHCYKFLLKKKENYHVITIKIVPYWLKTRENRSCLVSMGHIIILNTLQRRYNAGDGSHKIEPRYK